MTCPDCEFEWERQLSANITRQAADSPILSKSEPVWRTVTKRSFYRHEKFGSAPSIRVEYLCGFATFKEWIPVENERAAGLVAKFWRQHGGTEPIPATVSDALNRVGELRAVSEIRVEPDGKFWKITGKRFELESVAA
jgi:DNA repair protein RadD